MFILWKKRHHFLLYLLFLLILLKVLNTNEIFSQKLSLLLTPYRSGLKINPLFSHFTPFNDMLYADASKQRYGAVKKSLIERLNAIHISRNNHGDFHRIIEHYKDLALLLINNTITDNNERRISETLHDIINNTFFNPVDTDNLHYIHLTNTTNITTSDFKFIRSIYKKSIMPAKYIPGKPLHMLLMNAWRLYYLLAISSSNLWFRFRPTRDDFYEGDISKIHDDWSLLFIYDLCNTISELNSLNNNNNNNTNSNNSITYNIPFGFCPNPCLTNPCLEATHTISSQCLITGYLENDYKCECQTDHKWDQIRGYKGHCKTEGICEKYCDKVGTRRCNIIQGRHFCLCHPTHMGINCNTTRDPCVEVASGIPGNMACNIANGGVCLGTLGTNTYYCQCPSSLTSDPSYLFPNCLAFRDRCVSTVCIRGDCVSSKNGQETYCICPEEAYGKYCEFIRGKWSQWSPWSECSPNCGLDYHQRRIRTRDCLGEACQGGLGHFHMELCEVFPCPDETLALSGQIRAQEVYELKIQMLQAQASRYVKMSGAIAECLLLITCIFSAASVTAMILAVHCL
ncbi:unnamed protein product [Trichobilharzia szidati]|nr:unnamed protein product [Trichobilharzia szidati]